MPCTENIWDYIVKEHCQYQNLWKHSFCNTCIKVEDREETSGFTHGCNSINFSSYVRYSVQNGNSSELEGKLRSHVESYNIRTLILENPLEYSGRVFSEIIPGTRDRCLFFKGVYVNFAQPRLLGSLHGELKFASSHFYQSPTSVFWHRCSSYPWICLLPLQIVKIAVLSSGPCSSGFLINCSYMRIKGRVKSKWFS